MKGSIKQVPTIIDYELNLVLTEDELKLLEYLFKYNCTISNMLETNVFHRKDDLRQLMIAIWTILVDKV